MKNGKKNFAQSSGTKGQGRSKSDITETEKKSV
jgi:hypothetical protein